MISPKLVRELFDYKDGQLFFRERPREHFLTDRGFNVWKARYARRHLIEAGYHNDGGYRAVEVSMKGKAHSYLSHRLVWAWHYGKWPNGEIDHIDHDTSNNRIENLRDVTHEENMKNKRKRKTNTSGVTGVVWNKNNAKWNAFICVSSRRKHLGLFESFEDAVAARKEAEKLYGYHKNHGKEVI